MSDPGREIDELIDRARRGQPEALGRLLEDRRGALKAAAERQLRGRLSARLDASDVVQLTFLEAHQSFGQFHGEGEPELAAWLRRILHHNIASVVRDNTIAARRDARRERSLFDPAAGAGGDGSALWRALDGGGPSPSHGAIRVEDVNRLVTALASLPADQREAVRLRHLEGWSLAAIADKLGRSRPAAAGLIKRGIQALRRELHGEAEGPGPGASRP